MSSKRILDFSLTPARLRVRDRQLKIFDGETLRDSVPIEDVAVVILAHPQLTVSAELLRQLLDANVVIVVCDDRSIPNGICFPLYGHHTGAQRVQLQVAASSDRPLMKRLWKQIVKQKIKNQSRLLQELFQTDGGLTEYFKGVKSGDSDNREGIAARKYWAKLFEGIDFRRDYDGKDPVNAALNYGYSILRAIVARAVVSVGFCPTIGICHHNKYNGYALADDLLEPFRPVVDRCVYALLANSFLDEGLTVDVKGRIVRQITGRYLIDGEHVNVFETTVKTAESLVWIYRGEAGQLAYPARLPFESVDALNLNVKKPILPIEDQKTVWQKEPPF